MKNKCLSVLVLFLFLAMIGCNGDVTTSFSTDLITTEAPTTISPTTWEPTTQAPTTQTPTTEAPTTQVPTTEAPTTQIPTETIRLYFYNSDIWNRVYLYAFHEQYFDMAGEWPGKSSFKESSTNWWYVDIEVPTVLSEFYVVFNDGNELKTIDVLITNEYYITVDGQTFSTKILAEEAIDGPLVETRVWFYNSQSWEEIFAYVWNDDGEITGTWPGTSVDGPMDIEMDHDWVYIDVPLDANDTFNIIFSNGIDRQTIDVLIDDQSALFLTVNGQKYASKALAEEAMSLDPVITTYWFYNSEGWDNVYVYGWINSNQFLGSWPGQLMENDLETNWWSIDIDIDPETTSFNLIFTNNQGQQTADLLIEQSINRYITYDGGFFDSREAAEMSFENE